VNTYYIIECKTEHRAIVKRTKTAQKTTMTDVVVSIRMPTSLVKELKILSEQNHFKDLSEEIRSVVRVKCLQYIQPNNSKLQKLHEELSQQLVIKKEWERKQQLVEDLKKIVKKLQNEK